MALQDHALDERIPPLAAARFGWPLPPLAGADGAADPPADPPTDTPADPPAADPADDGGDDLQTWKGHARKHEKRAKEATTRAEKAEAELAKLREAGQTEQEKALEQARKEAADAARAEITGKTRDKLLKAEIRAHAAGRFADVEDAIKLVDLDDDIFDDEGEVQTDALKSALDQLLERKPHLAAKSGQVTGDPDAGKGKGAKDLESMSVEEHLARIRKTAA